MIEQIEVGSVLLLETCDEILLDLKGNSQSVNPHTEHWLVEDITKDNVKLYNLDNQRTWKLDKKSLAVMLKGNERMGIKPMFTISNEVA